MNRRTARKAQGPASFDLESFLPYRLSLLANTVSQGIAHGYSRRYGISVTEWRVLAVLGRYPGLTASAVTERTAMDKVAVSRAVKSLMEKGLLRRRTDASDRRRQRLFLTAEPGETVLQSILPLARRYEQQLLQELDEEETAALSRAIEKLQHQANTLNHAP